MTTGYNITLIFDETQRNYIEASARIRKMKSAALLRALVRTIADEQLILSVLDDDNQPTIKVSTKGRTATEKRKMGRPVDNNPFHGLQTRKPGGSVPQRKQFSIYKKVEERSKDAMREEIHQAVLNTAKEST